MPTPGYVFRDSGVTPPAEEESETQDKRLSSKPSHSKASPTPPRRNQIASTSPIQQKSSDSHAIAVGDHDVKGAAQKAGRTRDLTDLGWRAPAKDLDTLVGKLPNEELWALVRRFNKQTYHLKTMPTAPPGGLDLNIADEDEFSPDKLRANIERLYVTVIIGLIGFGKLIARLRSWREPRRTAVACAGYFFAWLIGCLVPLSMLLLVVLIAVPKSRTVLFPPAPIALVDSKTGGIQKPRAGVLGSHDTATGAPEMHQGEAVEQEASNLVSGIASVALASASGRQDQRDPEDAKIESNIPDPTEMANATAESRSSVQGAVPIEKHDKTKQPMEEAVWAKMRPAMHVIGDVADTWERFANALSATPPFPHTAQYQLAALVVPLFLLSLFIKSAHVVHGSTFFSGLIFFSDPIQQRGIQLLNEKVPNWLDYLQLRNTILKGVPTNAQLTITLLRIGEANRAPLPPPPNSDSPLPDEAAEIDKTAITDGGLDASHTEIDDAITIDKPSSDTDSTAAANSKSGGTGSKITSVFKSTTAAGIGTKIGAIDKGRAAIGSVHAKEKIGILPEKAELGKSPRQGPFEFKCRYNGTKGAVYLDSSVSPASGSRPSSPCIYFTTHLHDNNNNNNSDNGNDDGKPASNSQGAKAAPQPQWIVSISDITEVKKVGGLGWKGKLIVGWATDRSVKDGLEISVRGGQGWKVTALRERNELFNRVVAVGGQVWESW